MDNFNESQRDRDRSRRGDKPSRFSDANPRDRSRDKPGRENSVFVSNIPYDSKWTDVKQLFRRHVGDVVFVKLFNDENDKPRGCGIVEFSSPEFVKKAMEVMPKFPLDGRKLIIKEDCGTVRNKFGHPVGHERDDSGMRNNRNDNWNHSSGGGGMQGDGERFNTYGLSLQFLDSINIREALLNRIFVANLDYKVDKKKLKEVFRMAGKVRNIDLSTDKDGNSRGFAVIEYDHPVEAVQAISMFDKQILFERKLAVRMDRAGSGPSEVRLPEGLLAIGPGLGPAGEPLRDVVSNLPQQQPPVQQVQAGGAGLLGAVPALSGLGLQALGQLGLGQLQSQLLQQSLAAGDLSALNNAGALSASGLGLQELSGANSMQGPQMGNNSFSNNNNFSGLNNTAFNRGMNMTPGSGLNSLNSGLNSAINSNMGFPHQPPSGRASPGGFGGNRMSSNSPYSPYGGDRAQRDMDGMDGQNNQEKPGDMVLIKYLPASVTWQLLREKFGEAGEVKMAEKIDSETAVIRFQSEWGATRAIKMFDKTRIDGKTIVVRNC